MDTIAWIVHNSPKAKRSQLDQYLVSAAKLERLIYTPINSVPGKWKSLKPSSPWPILKGCDRS